VRGVQPGAGQWLHGRNRLAELLKLGEVDEVRRAGAAFAEGSFV